jgi:hypothetical protein
MPFAAGEVQEWDAASLVTEIAQSILSSGKPWLLTMSSCHSSWFAARLARELPPNQMPITLSFATLVQGSLCEAVVPRFVRSVLDVMALAPPDLSYDAWLSEARLAAHAAFVAVTKDAVEACWALIDPSDDFVASRVRRAHIGGIPVLMMRVLPEGDEGGADAGTAGECVVPTDEELDEAAPAAAAAAAPAAGVAGVARAAVSSGSIGGEGALAPDDGGLAAEISRALLRQLTQQPGAAAAAVSAGVGVVDGGCASIRVVPYEANFCVRERLEALTLDGAGPTPTALAAVHVRALLAISMPLDSDPLSLRQVGHALVAKWVLHRVLYNDRSIGPTFSAGVFHGWPDGSHLELRDALQRRLLGAAFDAEFAKPGSSGSSTAASSPSSGAASAQLTVRHEGELVVMTREQMEQLLLAAAQGRAALRGGSHVTPTGPSSSASITAAAAAGSASSPASCTDPTPPPRSAFESVAAVYRGSTLSPLLAVAAASHSPSSGPMSAATLRARPPQVERRGSSRTLTPLPLPGASPAALLPANTVRNAAPSAASSASPVAATAVAAIVAPVTGAAAASALRPNPFSLALHAQIAEGPDPGGIDAAPLRGAVPAAPGLEVDVLIRVAAARDFPASDTLPLAVVAAVDCSSAMDAPVAAGGVRSRLDVVRDAVRCMLRKLRPCDHFGVVAFAGAPSDARAVCALQAATPAAVDDACHALGSRLTTSAGTCIYAGIYAAHMELRRCSEAMGRSVIVLLTASSETAIAPTNAYADMTAQLVSERISVHTLGCSSDAAISALAELAAVTAGSYTAVPEAADVELLASTESPLLRAVGELMSTLTSGVTPNLKLRVPAQPALVHVSGVGAAYRRWPPGDGGPANAAYPAGVDFGYIAAGEERDVLLRVRVDNTGENQFQV